MDIRVTQAEDAPWTCKATAMLMAGALLCQTAGFLFWLPDRQVFYYVAAVLSLMYVISGGLHLDRRYFIFLLILGLNAYLLPIDPVFNARIRFSFFAMIMLVCSPLISNGRAIVFRQHVFKYLLIGMIPLVLGSFICFFADINLMPYNRRELQIELFADYETKGGRFSGLFAHSMTLGPIAALVALLFYVRYQQEDRHLWLMSFLVAAVATVMSASRAAILGLVLSITGVVLFSRNASKHNKRLIVIACVGALALAPIADRVTAGVINKQKGRIEENDGDLNSRSGKFDARLNEFASSPIWGIGFASVDGMYDVYNPINGQIEPGTSHLAVLSMTGLMGFVAYCGVLLHAYRCVRRQNSQRALFLEACFLAFFVHMWFEGYVFGAGGILCFLFWLVISQCIDSRYAAKGSGRAFCK